MFVHVASCIFPPIQECPHRLSMTHISPAGEHFGKCAQDLQHFFSIAAAEDFMGAHEATKERYQLAVKNLGASLLMVSMRLAVAKKELTAFSPLSTSQVCVFKARVIVIQCFPLDPCAG